MSKAIRSTNTCLTLLEQEYKFICTYERRSKLLLGIPLLGRMVELCKLAVKSQKQISIADAISTEAK